MYIIIKIIQKGNMKSIIKYITESNKNRLVGGTSYLEQEIYDSLEWNIMDLLNEADIADEVEILELWCHGSRMRGDFCSDSDIDVVVFYKGNIKEDALFNILNDEHERETMDGYIIDLNPIQVRNKSDIERYKKKSNEYDKEKLASNKN